MIYDVSLFLSESCPTFPGDPKFNRVSVMDMERGDRCNNSRLHLGAHTGTHVDAPRHMMKNGTTVDGLDCESLVGPARVIEVTDPTKVTEEELRKHSLVGVSRVLFKTRNSKHWVSREFLPNFVYLDPKGAEYLSRFSFKLVGIDSLSLEKYQANSFESHLILMKKNIVILEGLNLGGVPAGDYCLFCGPLSIVGGDGAPARVFLVDRETVREWLG